MKKSQTLKVKDDKGYLHFHQVVLQKSCFRNNESKKPKNLRYYVTKAIYFSFAKRVLSRAIDKLLQNIRNHL